MKITFKLPRDLHPKDFLIMVIVIFLGVIAAIIFEAYHLSQQANDPLDVSTVSPVTISEPDVKIFDVLRQKE